MKFEGSWLLGDRGAARLFKLAHALHSKFEKELFSKLGVISTYQPWMSIRQHDASSSGKSALTCMPNTGLGAVETCADKIDLIRNLIGTADAPFKFVDSSINWFCFSDRKVVMENKFILDDAIGLLSSSSQSFDVRVSKLIKQIILIEAAPNHRLRPMGSGMSAHWFIGGVFIGLPIKFDYRRIELAINISHELGHQALMVYQQADRILSDDLSEPVWSSIRRAQRPAILSFHAALALGYIAEFLFEIQSSNLISADERAYARRRLDETKADLRIALFALKPIPKTKLGISIFHELSMFESFLSAS